MQDGSTGCGDAVGVRVDQKIVIGLEDRVVGHGVMEPDLYAVHLGQRPAVDEGLAGLRGHRLANALVTPTRGNACSVRIPERDPQGSAAARPLPEGAQDAHVLSEEEARVRQDPGPRSFDAARARCGELRPEAVGGVVQEATEGRSVVGIRPDSQRWTVLGSTSRRLTTSPSVSRASWRARRNRSFTGLPGMQSKKHLGTAEPPLFRANPGPAEEAALWAAHLREQGKGAEKGRRESSGAVRWSRGESAQVAPWRKGDL